MRTDSRTRLHAVLAALPLTVWTCFHLWQQWAVFAGRDAWLERMRGTSGPLATVIELVLVVAPLAIWSGLALIDLAQRKSLPHAARPEDRGFARAIGLVAPVGTALAILFLAVHVGHLLGPRLFRGATELETWSALTHDLGRPWMLALYAVGLTGIALHLAAAIPTALESLGWIAGEESRRSALVVSAIFALCVWILAAQLVGWLGTGTGTFWPISVVEAPDPMER